MPKENEIKFIIDRLNKLEKKVFGSGAKKKEKIDEEKFLGISGGLRFLVSKGFFNSKRTLAEIKIELNKNNYFSSIQAVQTALNRFSKPGGLLISFKEGGKKFYAKRK